MTVSISAASVVDATGWSAELVAWICFAAGLALVGLGVYLGLTTKAVAKKEAEGKIEAAQDAVDQLAAQGQAQVGAEAQLGPTAAATKAEIETTKDEAKSKLGDLGTIIGSLPEHLRFAGLLVLIGAVLVSVATVQFGGTALF